MQLQSVAKFATLPGLAGTSLICQEPSSVQELDRNAPECCRAVDRRTLL